MASRTVLDVETLLGLEQQPWPLGGAADEAADEGVVIIRAPAIWIFAGAGDDDGPDAVSGTAEAGNTMITGGAAGEGSSVGAAGVTVADGGVTGDTVGL